MSQRSRKSAFLILNPPITHLPDPWLPDSHPSLSNVDLSNIVSFPNYPITLPYSRIRSSQNLAIFYSKLLGPEGGFELDPNRANTAVNQHFLSTFTVPRPRFPNIEYLCPIN